jgi:hypothetical protein
LQILGQPCEFYLFRPGAYTPAAGLSHGAAVAQLVADVKLVFKNCR